jgi:hypothetical protein
MSAHGPRVPRRPGRGPHCKQADLVDTVEFVPPPAPLAPGEDVFSLLRAYETAKREHRWADRERIWERLKALTKRPSGRRRTDGDAAG